MLTTELERMAALGPGLSKILANKASSDETLAWVDQLLTWLETEDPALAPRVKLAHEFIKGWRSYGPGGPFAPAATGITGDAPSTGPRSGR